jgi:hypothetical protein
VHTGDRHVASHTAVELRPIVTNVTASAQSGPFGPPRASVRCSTVTTPTLERRRHQRFPASFRVRCTRIGKEETTAEVDAVDVSRSGLRIIAPHGVAAGDVLSLVLNPLDPVETTGIVVTCRPAFDVRGRREAHIAFTKVTADVQRELDRLIALAQERVAPNR